ncbi:MAG: DNA-binding transcription factor yap1 [Phylliscum demangeonii]|nr:MAG: DNA-binding transcription factor yap1 [Phylliscum demangeonii]
MATTSYDDVFNPDVYLSTDQQNLLFAAFASNNAPVSKSGSAGPLTTNPAALHSLSSVGASPNRSQQTPARAAGLPAETLVQQQRLIEGSSNETLHLDNDLAVDLGLDLDFENGLEFDVGDNEDDLAESQEAVGETEADGDIHDKRKGSDDLKAEGESSAKRREASVEKTAKKPGRKPLTSEPTSKRKAQNRAAQRAFRERKEKHLKDLEVKVADLEKASESANHENGLLRAQVARLQDELKEYRKRLAGGRRPSGHSPPGHPSFMSRTADGIDNNNTFQFEFPKFGGLPGSRLFNTGSFAKADAEPARNSFGASSVVPYPSPPTAPRIDSFSLKSSSAGSETKASPSGSMSSVSKKNETSPVNRPVADKLTSDAASFSGLRSAGGPNQPGTSLSEHSAGTSSAPAGLSSVGLLASASPSASSVSQLGGANSSACTSPESYQNSPMNNSKGLGTPMNTINEEFMSPSATMGSAFLQANGAQGLSKDSMSSVNGIDWLVQQNGGQFDPVLFGDYREPQDAIISGDTGFFSDAFPLYDFSLFTDHAAAPTPAPASTPSAKMASVKPLLVDEEVASDAATKAVASTAQAAEPVQVNCDKLWAHIQRNEHFKNGELDIDSLCSDLQRKARCSETGMVFDQQVVDAVLAKFSKAQPQSGTLSNGSHAAAPAPTSSSL